MPDSEIGRLLLEADQVPGASNRSAIQQRTLVRLFRALASFLAWLPTFWIIAFAVPPCGPIFQKLKEKEELPKETQWVWEFTQFNEAYYGAPTVFGFAALIGMSEFAMAVLIRTQPSLPRESPVVVAVGLVVWGILIGIGIVSFFALLISLKLPVFRDSFS